MYKQSFYFVVAFLLSGIMAFGQVQPTIFQMEDHYEFDSSKTVIVPRYGGDFTPKGVIKIPIIYAGFYSPTYQDNATFYNNFWPSIDTATGLHTTVPDYALDTTSLMQIIFQTEAQLFNPQYANIKNLTRYYYEMSDSTLIVLGDVFRDPDTSSSSYGQPIRININAAGSSSWSSLNLKVLQKIRDTYGAYWDEIWEPFDLRINVPSFSTDTVYAIGDSIVDFAIIHYRYSAGWDSINQPIYTMPGWTGSLGGVAGLSTLSYSNYQVGPRGFTATGGGLSATEVVEFYPHELAHRVYNCPHYMGANSTIGNKFTRPNAGWGMMSGNFKSIFCANAFERWLLGWTDIKCDTTVTDFGQQSALNPTGVYTVRDFLSTGDCIRIKVPNTTDRYLWIEFHKKDHLFDYKNSVGMNPSSDAGRTELVPDFEAGVYMYIEHFIPDRDSAVYEYGDINSFLPLNAQGNWDYVYTDTPKVVTHNSVECLNPGYYWNNPTYTFRRSSENPISGTNAWFDFPNDFIVYADTNGDYFKERYVEKNNSISRSGIDINKCSNCEKVTIQCESNNTDFSNDIMAYNNTFGRNDEAMDTLGLSRRSDAFQERDEVGLSGIMPVLNYPDYLPTSNKIDNYILNGLTVKRLSNDANGNARIFISFEDYTVRENKRWCGYINLLDNTSDTLADLIVDTAVTVTIDKSGTPNRLTLLDGDFVNYTVLTCKPNSKVLQDINSVVEVLNKSTLLLDTNSVYEVKSGAELNIKSNSQLVMQPNSILLVRDSATVFIEDTSDFQFNGGSIVLEGNNSKLEIEGTLFIAQNTTFTFTGDGYVKFSSPDTLSDNIVAGDSASIEFSGNDTSDVVVEVAQESMYIPDSVANFTIQNAQVYFQHNQARVAVLDGNTVINVDSVKFTPQSANRTSHRGLQVFGHPYCTITDCFFEKGFYGIFGYLTYNGAYLTVSGCTFDDCNNGIWINDKSLIVSNSTFTDCSSGVYTQATSFDNNEISGCVFDNCDIPVRHLNSTGDLYMEYNNINYANTHAVSIQGSVTYTAYCNSITGVSPSNAADIYAVYNVVVSLGNNLSVLGGYNELSTNGCQIILSAANMVYMGYGHNKFYPNGSTYKLYGTLTFSVCGGKTYLIPARANQWYNNTNSLNSSNYLLAKNGCTYEHYTVDGSLAALYYPCEGEGMMSSGESEISGIINEDLIGMELSSATAEQLTAESNNDWESVFSTYNAIFDNVGVNNTNDVEIWERAWRGVTHSLKQMYLLKQIQNNSLYFLSTLQTLEKMKQIHVNNTSRLFFLEVEKATLYRLNEDYPTAINILENLLTSADSADVAEYIQRWICILNVDKDVKAGIIPPSEIESYSSACDFSAYEVKSGSVSNFENRENNILKTSLEVDVIPNPVSFQSVISVVLPDDNTATIEIVDIEGRTIKSFNIAEQKTNINVRSNDLPKGIYSIKVLTSGGLTKTTRMIIQ